MLSDDSGDGEKFVLTPSAQSLFVLGFICSIGIIFLALSIYADLLLYGIFIFSLFLWIFLLVATIRVKVLPDRIERWVFWRISWSENLLSVDIVDGLGGDIPLMPALIFISRNTGKKVGEIIKSQFRASDLSDMMSAINRNRAILSGE